MDPQQQARLRRIGRQILWAVGAVVAVSAVVFVINRFFVHHPLWDWLELLIVPVVLAGGGIWFNAQQREREQRIANDRAQDEALQAYLDQMSDMLIPGEGQPSLYKARPGDSLSSVARARTLTVLPRLEGGRKARVLQFLYEAGLINKGDPVLRLWGADLRGVILKGALLSNASLHGADLRGASLVGIALSHADLSWTSLHGVVMMEVILDSADLRDANLSYANLSYVSLRYANLSGVVLDGARLRTVNLLAAKGTASAHIGVHLEAKATSLKGVTMPNGQKYEDWLKDKEGGKND